MMPEHALLEADTTRKVIGAFYHVYNALGYGFSESVYRRALAHVLERSGLGVRREQAVTVVFEDVVVGEYRLDLLVDGRVVVETKAAERVHPSHEAQLLNYLRAAGIEVGLLLNFGARAEYRRFVLTRRENRFYVAERNSG